MKRPILTSKQELEAEIRNKLTMPMTVLTTFLSGKKVAKKNIERAIEELEKILKIMRSNYKY